MNYDSYRLSKYEWVQIIGIGIIVTFGVGILFYDSLWTFLGIGAVIYFLGKHKIKKRVKEQQEELTNQFMSTLQSISNSLVAGDSLENAWITAEKEMSALYGEDAPITRELREMNRSICMNEPIEKLMEDFAKRSGSEDIQSFSEVFMYAKRNGRNLVAIIESTFQRMKAVYETGRDIDVLVSAKRYEQKIMNLIPIGILAYLRWSSDEYISILYGNAFGIAFMTTCLLLYFASIKIAEKIIDIRV